MKIAIGIVTFRESYCNTITYQSILESINISNVDNYSIIVYDNTDNRDKVGDLEEIDNERVSYYHNPQNPGISVAYNFIAYQARKQGATWVLFLDQDTKLPPNSLKEYCDSLQINNNILIKVPILRINKKIFSPLKHFFHRAVRLRKLQPGIYDLNTYNFVNSGIFINLDFFEKVGGYNENIKLDFADYQFIDRVKKHTNKFELLPIECWHSSSQEESDKSKAIFRYNIFLKDIANCKRNSLKDYIGYFLVDILHLGKLTLKFKTIDFIKLYTQTKYL